jgi:putative oxidoreductase
MDTTVSRAPFTSSLSPAAGEHQLASAVAALGRVLLALIFIRGGIGKIGAIGATVTNMASHGVPFPDLLVYGAIAVELGGGLMLVAGLFTRWVGLVLGIYTLILALMFHGYWAMPAAQAREQASVFFGHLSMMGGMLYVAAFGSGAFGLDALRGRRR